MTINETINEACIEEGIFLVQDFFFFAAAGQDWLHHPQLQGFPKQ